MSPAHSSRRGWSRERPEAPSQNTPGSSREGSTSAAKRRSRGNQAGHGLVDGRAGNDVRPEMARKREPRAVAHARKDARGMRPGVHPENGPLGLVPVHHRGGMVLPVRMVPEQQLQGKGRNVNTGHPFHGTTPCGSIPERPVCP